MPTMMTTALSVIWMLGCMAVLSGISIAIYRLYFHPLSVYPGPRLWAISRLPNAFNLIMGRLPYRILEHHEKYGSVVRIAPNELAYASATAWDDIYGNPVTRRTQLQRDDASFIPPPNGVFGLTFEPSDKEHARMRRNLSHGFSQKALAEQEPLLMKHVDLFISKLQENCGKSIDMVRWYSFLTLDIIGDLLFGESFDCLEIGTLHFWPATIFRFVKIGIILSVTKKFSPLDKILLFLAPASLRKAESDHRALTEAKLTKRLNSRGSRSDFLSYASAHYKAPEGMSFEELVESTGIFMVAGSETSASALSAATYYLLTNPEVFHKLKKEVRDAYKTDKDITITSVNSLRYQNAVIRETLRMFPPVAAVLARVTPQQGCIVSGQFVAGNTTVGITHLAAYNFSKNFRRANEFIPERWTGDAEFTTDEKQVMQPFSVGQRNCLGQNLANAELRLILAKVVWNFDIELCEYDKGWENGFNIYLIRDLGPLVVKLKSVRN